MSWHDNKDVTTNNLNRWCLWWSSIMAYCISRPQLVKSLLMTLDISWCNIVKYCTHYNNFGGTTLVTLRTHERHPYLALMGDIWVSFVSYLGKSDRDISVVHCNWLIHWSFVSISFHILCLESKIIPQYIWMFMRVLENPYDNKPIKPMNYLPLVCPTHAGESCALENIQLSLNSLFQMIVDIRECKNCPQTMPTSMYLFFGLHQLGGLKNSAKLSLNGWHHSSRWRIRCNISSCRKSHLCSTHNNPPELQLLHGVNSVKQRALVANATERKCAQLNEDILIHIFLQI